MTRAWPGLVLVACHGTPSSASDAAVDAAHPVDASVVDAADAAITVDAMDARVEGCGPDSIETTPDHCIDRYEVTVADYRACASAKLCSQPAVTSEWNGIRDVDHGLFDPLCTASASDADRRPMTCVDFKSAGDYCASRQRKLPSSADWDAIAGADPYPWGIGSPVSGLLNACGSECVAWKKAHAGDLARSTMPGLDVRGDAFPGDDGNLGPGPVGSFPMGNATSGAADVLGNVAEWTSEGSAGRHVVRGGSWLSSRGELKKSSPRLLVPDSTRTATIGFRCVR